MGDMLVSFLVSHLFILTHNIELCHLREVCIDAITCCADCDEQIALHGLIKILDFETWFV
jgi:hypothetical protein